MCVHNEYVDVHVYIPVVYICVLRLWHFYKSKLLLFISYCCTRSVMDPAMGCTVWMEMMMSQSVCNPNT